MKPAQAVVIGSLTMILIAAVSVIGLRWALSEPSGDTVPLWEQAAWDGTQFVINDADIVGQPEHWTSPDGIEWERHPGLVLDVGVRRCHPDFPCDLRPDVIPKVPLLFAEPQSWIVAGRDDIALTEVNVRYNTGRERSSLEEQPAGVSVQLHPSILAMAAQESDCFEEIRRGGPNYVPDFDEAHLSGYGSGSSGDDWRFNATCRKGGDEKTFSIDLSAHLDETELRLFERGTESELWVVRSDGSSERVENPPTITYRDDTGNDDSWTAIAGIAATGSRFWSAGDDGLLVSSNGTEWVSFAVDTDGWVIDGVTANPGGDIALLLTDEPDHVDRGTKLVMVSHDDGQNWSDIIPVGSDGQSVFVASVGPAGVAVSRGESGGEREMFIDDRLGTVVFSARSPVGSNALVVGAATVLMPRERIAANGELLGPVLDVYDTDGELVTTVFPD